MSFTHGLQTPPNPNPPFGVMSMGLFLNHLDYSKLTFFMVWYFLYVWLFNLFVNHVILVKFTKYLFKNSGKSCCLLEALNEDVSVDRKKKHMREATDMAIYPVTDQCSSFRTSQASFLGIKPIFLLTPLITSFSKSAQ